MTDPTVALGAVRASTAALVHGLTAQQWTDDDVRAPSLLPDWSRGHVLTHIARNADGITRTLSGALRGERVPRYPDGPAGRNADIEAGAGRGSIELLTDVRESAERLDRVLSALADADGWELPADDRSAGEYLPARWREVEIHRVDLDAAYTPQDWPPEFVAYLLPELAEKLPGRTDTPLTITVAEDGSLVPGLVGRSWAVPGDAPAEVSGPDWALLAWLTGRPHGLDAPQLDPWS